MPDTPLSPLATSLLQRHLSGPQSGIGGGGGSDSVLGATPGEVRRAYQELVGAGLLRPRVYSEDGREPVEYEVTPAAVKRHGSL